MRAPTRQPASTDDRKAIPEPRAPAKGSSVLAGWGSSVGWPSASSVQPLDSWRPYIRRLSTLPQDETPHAMSSTNGAPDRVGTPQATALLAVPGLLLPYAATVAAPVLVVGKPIISA